MKLKEECTECLTEMKEKSEQIHHNLASEIKEDARIVFSSIKDSTTIHLAAQENKYDAFEKKVFGLIAWFMGGIGFVILICATIVGYTWVEVQKKADASKVPTMTEIQALRELGDQYNKSVFIRKPVVTADTSAYFFARKNIYGEYSIMRSDVKTN